MNREEQRPGFEPRDWWDRVGPLLPSQYGWWSTRDVIGPRDACWVVRIRDMVRDLVSFGPPVPADVFVLAVGEAPSRDETKIGGLPFWPHDREWPRSRTGQPLPFLAQFCFRGSLDIVGSLPADMLLLFGDKDHPSTVVAEWQSSRCRARLVDLDDVPVKAATPCFYGTRWRTENFPDAKYDDPVGLADGSNVNHMWFVCRLLGMQIGRYPYFPEWSGRPLERGRVVCSMSAVFPMPGLPHPFVNRPSPLTDEEASGLSLDLSERKDADGFGVLCVVVTDSGEPVVLHEDL